MNDVIFEKTFLCPKMIFKEDSVDIGGDIFMYKYIEEIELKSSGNLLIRYAGKKHTYPTSKDAQAQLPLLIDMISKFPKEEAPKSEKKTLKKAIQASAGNSVFEKAEYVLAPKDGNVHVLMVNSFSKFINQNFGVDDKFTVQIDSILQNLQSKGYEIVDIKFNSMQGQGLTGNLEGFHTLIMYR